MFFLHRCSLAGESIQVLNVQPRPSVTLLLAAAYHPDGELSTTSPAPCLPAGHHASLREDHGLKALNRNPAMLTLQELCFI